MDDGYLVAQAGRNGDAAQTSVRAFSPPATCRIESYQQACTSAGSGCMAALDAERSVDNLGH